MQALTAPAMEYARLQQAAQQPLQFGRIGPTNYQPVSELPYTATPSTGMIMGSALGSLGTQLGGLYAANQQHQQMQDLQDAAFGQQNKLQKKYFKGQQQLELQRQGLPYGGGTGRDPYS